MTGGGELDVAYVPGVLMSRTARAHFLTDRGHHVG
jgi:hypothetical protein